MEQGQEELNRIKIIILDKLSKKVGPKPFTL
jgi:hypothetical protein